MSVIHFVSRKETFSVYWPFFGILDQIVVLGYRFGAIV